MSCHNQDMTEETMLRTHKKLFSNHPLAPWTLCSDTDTDFDCKRK